MSRHQKETCISLILISYDDLVGQPSGFECDVYGSRLLCSIAYSYTVYDSRCEYSKQSWWSRACWTTWTKTNSGLKSYAQIELISSIFLLDSMYKNKYFVKPLILQKWTEKRIAVKTKLPDLLYISGSTILNNITTTNSSFQPHEMLV